MTNHFGKSMKTGERNKRGDICIKEKRQIRLKMKVKTKSEGKWGNKRKNGTHGCR
jgi:hypothetical protein